MPIFNLSTFNFNNAFQLLNQIPPTSPYSNIKFYGGGRFDNVHGEEYVYDQTKIDSLDFYSDPLWTVPTFLLMLFNNDLQGGNIVSLPSPIDKWLVFRKNQTDAKYTKIAELPAATESYVDRLASSKQIYSYTLIPQSNDLLGESLLADPATTDFTRVILLDDTVGYSFCLDLEMSDISTEQDITVSQTKGKYDTVLQGNKNAKVGSIGVILKSNSSTEIEIQQDAAYIDEFEAFITRSGSKVLKFPKGFSYRVYTSDFSKIAKDGYDSEGNIVYRVSFQWREIAEVM